MSEFKDGQNREWKLNLNVGMIEDIKETTGIDLDDLIQHPNKMAEMIFLSPRKMVEMLWVCCEDQAKELQITPRDFGRMFDRDLLDKACDAFLGAVMLFYPRSSVGKVIRESLPKMLAEMDKKLVKDVELKMEKVFSDIATDSPVS